MTVSSLIALGQVEALWFPPSHKVVQDEHLYNIYPDLRYEYLPPDPDKESLLWDVIGIIDDYFPQSFFDMVDPDWEEEGEFVYEEVIKLLPTHPDLQIIEGTIAPRQTGEYVSPEAQDHPLLVRFPVILRARFDFDSYTGETDCEYWFDGVPDLTHLEDLLPKKEEDRQKEK